MQVSFLFYEIGKFALCGAGYQIRRDSLKDFYVERVGGAMIVYIQKELDHHLARKIREEVDFLIDRGNVKYLILDFGGVSFMDSSGIGMIMGRYKKLRFFGGELRMSGIRPEVERIFSMSGIYKMGPVYPDVETAMAGILV